MSTQVEKRALNLLGLAFGLIGLVGLVWLAYQELHYRLTGVLGH